MKRIFAVILLAVLAVTAAGCAPRETEQATPLPTVLATLTADEDKVSCDYSLTLYPEGGEVTLSLPDVALSIQSMDPQGELGDGVVKWTALGSPATLSIRYEMTLPTEGPACYAKHLYILPDYLPALGSPCEVTVTWTLPSSYLMAHGGALVDRHYADGVQTRTYHLSCASRVALIAGSGLVGKQLPEEDDWHYYYVWDVRATATAMSYHRAYDFFRGTWGDLPNPQVALLTVDQEGVWEGVTVLPNALPAGNLSPIHAAAGAWWETLTVEGAPWISKSLSSYGVWYYLSRTDELGAYNYHLQAHRTATTYDFVRGQPTRMDLPLAAYDEESIAAILEGRGMLMWYTLYQVVGEALNRALASLPRDVAYTTATFVEAMAARLGPQYLGYFDAWLQGTVLLV